jgi:hypothetical protein
VEERNALWRKVIDKIKWHFLGWMVFGCSKGFLRKVYGNTLDVVGKTLLDLAGLRWAMVPGFVYGMIAGMEIHLSKKRYLELFMIARDRDAQVEDYMKLVKWRHILGPFIPQSRAV